MVLAAIALGMANIFYLAGNFKVKERYQLDIQRQLLRTVFRVVLISNQLKVSCLQQASDWVIRPWQTYLVRLEIVEWNRFVMSIFKPAGRIRTWCKVGSNLRCNVCMISYFYPRWTCAEQIFLSKSLGYCILRLLMLCRLMQWLGSLKCIEMGFRYDFISIGVAAVQNNDFASAKNLCLWWKTNKQQKFSGC